MSNLKELVAFALELGRSVDELVVYLEKLYPQSVKEMMESGFDLETELDLHVFNKECVPMFDVIDDDLKRFHIIMDVRASITRFSDKVDSDIYSVFCKGIKSKENLQKSSFVKLGYFELSKWRMRIADPASLKSACGYPRHMHIVYADLDYDEYYKIVEQRWLSMNEVVGLPLRVPSQFNVWCETQFLDYKEKRKSMQLS
jgi:hypothetical protein